MYEKIDKHKEKIICAERGSVSQKKNAYVVDKRKNNVIHQLQGMGGNRPVQCFPKDELKETLGSSFIEKHIANSGAPLLESREDQENVLESVYYHRLVDDRRPMNTVFFANAADINNDLKDNAEDELSYSEKYTTTESYPAITVLRVFKEQSGEYAKAEFQFGNAKPEVKLNKQDGKPSFNHLEKTDPKELEHKINLI